MNTSELELRRVREREIELKRITGEISCAECRRLKLRCDKKIPCHSCTRRGYKSICPTGTSISGGTRQIVTNTFVNSDASNDLDNARRMAAMSERIRALEDALQTATNAFHPLLSSELLSIKRMMNKDISNREDLPTGNNDEEELENAFGTLTISNGKATQFFGATASENVLLMNVLDHDPALQVSNVSDFPAELAQLSEMWPFVPTHLPHRSKLFQIGTYLPPLERVKQLVQAFFSQLRWLLDRLQVEEELIPLFYPDGCPLSPALLTSEHMHDLALLFMILAGGVLAERSESLIGSEAEKYQNLARVALSLNSVFETGSLSVCQVLVLLGSYEICVGRKAAPESAWKMMSMSLVHAASIGLHRDPSHWNLDPVMADRRRRIFWELFSLDKWKSLGSGRPEIFPCHVVDCEFPVDKCTVHHAGSQVESVRQWKFRFAKDVIAPLADYFTTARSQKYADIIKLDKLVRDFDVHPLVEHSLQYALPINAPDPHPLFSVCWKERALLYVHRNFFARAILEHGNDPIHSPYALSFLATIRSSSTILKTARLAFLHRGNQLKRQTQFWSLLMSAAVIFGLVASTALNSFSENALSELDKSIPLFKTSEHVVARHGLMLLLKLRNKAIRSLDNEQYRVSSLHLAGAMTKNNKNLIDDEDEALDKQLHAMRGTTRRIERQTEIPDLQKAFPSQRTFSAIPPNELMPERCVTEMVNSTSLGTASPYETIDMDSLMRFSEDSPRIPDSETSISPPSITRNGEEMQHNFEPFQWMHVGKDLSSGQNKDSSREKPSAPERGVRPCSQEHQLPGRQSDGSQSRFYHSGLQGVFSGSDILDSGTPLDRVFEDILAASYKDEDPSISETSGLGPATSDHPPDHLMSLLNGSDVTVSQSNPHTGGDHSRPHVVGNSTFPELWDSLVQQIDPTDGGNSILQDWHTMGYS